MNGMAARPLLPILNTPEFGRAEVKVGKVVFRRIMDFEDDWGSD